MNILVIGKLPPPVGGVSVFVKRTIEQYKKNGHSVDCITSSYIKKDVFFKLISRQYKSIILNTSSIAAMFFLFFLNLLKIVEYVDHNHSRHWKSGLKRNIIFYFLSKVRVVSIVNDHLIKNYPDCLHSSISIISPYIKPSEDRMEVRESFGEDYKKFIDKYDNLIFISAWRLIFEDNKDLYGIDFSISILPDILSNYSSAGLIIALGDSDFNSSYMSELKNKIDRLGLNEHVYWLLDLDVVWPVYGDVSIYLRPTTTDGNSISIHEANSFGCHVIASNVVPRPEFCKIYANRSALLNIIFGIFNETNPPKHKQR